MKELLLNSFITELMKDVSSTNQPSQKTQQSFDNWKADILKKREQYKEIETIYKTNHLEPRLRRELAVEHFITKNIQLKTEFLSSPKKHKKAKLRKWLKHIGSISTEFKNSPSQIYTIYPDSEEILYETN